MHPSTGRHFIYGSLVIYSPAGQIEPYSFDLPYHAKNQGEHRFLRFSRGWMTQTPTRDEDAFDATTLIIPARNKHLLIDTFSWEEVSAIEINHHVKKRLSTVDSDQDVENARHLHRLQLVMQQVKHDISFGHHDCPYVSCVNNTGLRSYIALLSSEVDIQLFGVVGNDASVQLVWSDDPDTEKRLRAKYGTSIHTYRFPPIRNQPLFIATQFVCSYWYRWTKNYENTPMAYLHAFNALQERLFKDPRVPTLPVTQAINMSVGSNTNER